ncbi:MAG: 3-methyl-2-oxobutanoate hydroxymethyltransferase [Flavobacterium sp. MedPE-SWcel]|mgnify:CR=1 FL=1|uniref:nuclear transport factor 2 family protein n=1 Tax=uncultured Flavobacterium sp. TaxID=165435 RepID=UPI000912738C|nr:nuclear transport factor 2 family protein [uncultured Flavobacterium sp.]OIQ16925.1 MAG: 3-methyl-2-oxobutanoate hydroxymethyltransferase [Flavobacterium sp. MedPE-SWcel]
MKKIILLFVFSISLSINAQEREVKEAIITFFDGMHTSDTLKIKSVCVKDILLQSISEGGEKGKLTEGTAEDFYKSIASIPSDMKIEERLLSYKIQIDGTMAHAWTPYEFYINDKLSHKGVNSFSLFNDNGTWKIVHIIDTRRR